jgi:hypothetical protein
VGIEHVQRGWFVSAAREQIVCVGQRSIGRERRLLRKKISRGSD